MTDVASNLIAIKRRIQEAGGAVLVAVSKGQSVEKILAAYDAGHRDFGESYVDEMKEKVDVLPDDIRWHFIGPIQSRKVKSFSETFRLCSLIHVVDRERVAKAICDRVFDGQPVDVLLQVNIGDEPQKSGVSTGDLISSFETLSSFSELRFRGLMAIPPWNEDPVPYFEKMRTFFTEIQEKFELGDAWSELSMGMSGDFVLAISHGATIVRVGTAIFGERNYE